MNHRRPRRIAVRILQSQLHSVNDVEPLDDPSIIIDVRRFGNEYSSALGKQRKDSATLKHMFVRVVEKLRTQATRTSVEAKWNPNRAQSGPFFLWP